MSSPFATWRKAGAPRRRQARRCGSSRKALEVRSAPLGKAPSDGGETEREGTDRRYRGRSEEVMGLEAMPKASLSESVKTPRLLQIVFGARPVPSDQV